MLAQVRPISTVRNCFKAVPSISSPAGVMGQLIVHSTFAARSLELEPIYGSLSDLFLRGTFQ